MDKRLTKRHERQVARAKERVWLSEPDLRTPEQIRAARKASRPQRAARLMLRAGHATSITPCLHSKLGRPLGQAVPRKPTFRRASEKGASDDCILYKLSTLQIY